MLERALIVPDDRRSALAAFNLVHGRICVANRTRQEILRR
jgi:hypothetical protein